MTSTTKTATTRDGCAYIYRQPKLTRCNRTREHHDRVRGLGHEFVGVDAQPPEHDAGLRDQTALCEDHNKPICDKCGYCVEDPEHQKHVAQSDTEQSRRGTREGEGATPRPWSVQRAKKGTTRYQITHPIYGVLANVVIGDPSNPRLNTEAGAKLIVRCVNAHESLIAALEEEFEALRIWLSNQNNAKPEIIEGMLISRQKIADALRQARGGE